MSLYLGATLIPEQQGSKLYVGASAVSKVYAGANLVWQAADTTAPSQPPSFTASASGTSISLSWGVATDNVAVTGYRVYRGATLLTTTTSRSYTDSGLSYSTSYSYSVSAIDAAGNESTKASASATTGSAPPPPQTYPQTIYTSGAANTPRGQTGTFTIGSCTLDPARTYQIAYYSYCDTSASYPSADYDNSYVDCTFKTSIGTASGPTLHVTTNGSSYSYTTGSFSGVSGSVTFSVQVTGTYLSGLSGSPAVTVTAVA